MAISEIVFFDLETTYPSKTGQKFFVLEFGAVVVCLKTLAELESYCTLIRPHDLSVVPVKSSRSHGITREEIANAPSFHEVADKIFKVLDGRIWAGHNIQRFDCIRIKEVFAQNNRPGPTPAGLIDSLGVLTQKFGKRAGNMKMATLADYFGLGQQKHRSLEDVRMNLEVLKHCATVLFLESSLPPGTLNGHLHNGPTVTTRSRGLIQSNSPESWRSNGREDRSRKSPPASTSHQRPVPYARESLGKMTDRVKNIFSYAKSQPLNNLLKHSKSIIR